VFIPVIKFHTIIGGYHNENGLVLREPAFVHYSESGELAITDTGNGTVYLLTPFLKVITKITAPFKSTVNIDLMDSYLKKQVLTHSPNLAHSLTHSLTHLTLLTHLLTHSLCVCR
jgi:hypothetical protein